MPRCSFVVAGEPIRGSRNVVAFLAFGGRGDRHCVQDDSRIASLIFVFSER
jgi:hypothetical protein